jgi:multicomponent K+:H+ antiporter subunit D
MVSGFVVMMTLTRAGIRVFWVPIENTVPTVRLLELGPIVALLLLCAALTVLAGPATRFMQATAAELYAPQTYIKDVLSAPRAQEGGS